MAAFVLVIFSATPMYVSFFALFLAPVSRDLGWDLATFPQGPFAFSVSFAITAPLAGRLTDRVNTRAVVALGVFLTTCGLLGLSIMSGALMPLVVASCLLGAGGSLVGVTSLAAFVAGHFRERRGLAMGVIFGSGPMLAAGAFSPIVSSIIAAFGWRDAYRTLALVSAGLSVLMILALRKPAEPELVVGIPRAGNAPGADLRDAFRHRVLWLILAASVLLPIVFGGVSGHLVALIGEYGVSASFGAAMLSATFLGGVVGPVAAGALADWSGRPQALLPFIAAPIVGMALLLGKATGVSLLAGSALIGLGFSAWSGQTALLITRYFSAGATGTIIGTTFAVGGVFLGLGPVILGLVRTASGSYGTALVLCIGLQALAVLLVALLPRFVRQPGEEDVSAVTGGAAVPGAGEALG